MKYYPFLIVSLRFPGAETCSSSRGINFYFCPFFHKSFSCTDLSTSLHVILQIEQFVCKPCTNQIFFTPTWYQLKRNPHILSFISKCVQNQTQAIGRSIVITDRTSPIIRIAQEQSFSSFQQELAWLVRCSICLLFALSRLQMGLLFKKTCLSALVPWCGPCNGSTSLQHEFIFYSSVRWINFPALYYLCAQIYIAFCSKKRIVCNGGAMVPFTLLHIKSNPITNEEIEIKGKVHQEKSEKIDENTKE